MNHNFAEIAYHSMIVDFGKYQSFQLARTWVIYLHGFTEIRDRGGVGGQFNVTQFVRKRALGKPNAEALSAKIIAKLPWEGLGGCESGWIAKIQGTAVSRCAPNTQPYPPACEDIHSHKTFIPAKYQNAMTFFTVDLSQHPLMSL